MVTCYSPVRHSGHQSKLRALVRLACVRHAASVRPEPGSNSPLRIRTFSSKRTLTICTDALLIERSEIYVVLTHSSPKAGTRTGRSACPLWARSNTLETSVFKQLGLLSKECSLRHRSGRWGTPLRAKTQRGHCLDRPLRGPIVLKVPNGVNTQAEPSVSGWMTGIEPATSGTTIRRSNRLSYTHQSLRTPPVPPGPRELPAQR